MRDGSSDLICLRDVCGACEKEERNKIAVNIAHLIPEFLFGDNLILIFFITIVVFELFIRCSTSQF